MDIPSFKTAEEGAALATRAEMDGDLALARAIRQQIVGRQPQDVVNADPPAPPAPVVETEDVVNQASSDAGSKQPRVAKKT